jgi:hypothetical protein
VTEGSPEGSDAANKDAVLDQLEEKGPLSGIYRT